MMQTANRSLRAETSYSKCVRTGSSSVQTRRLERSRIAVAVQPGQCTGRTASIRAVSFQESSLEKRTEALCVRISEKASLG